MIDAVPTITLHRPWAGWIARMWKTIETRRHARLKSLAGRWIAIHAGAEWDRRAVTCAEVRAPISIARQIKRECIGDHVKGAVIAIAHVKEHRALIASDNASALCECGGGNLHGLVFDQIHKFDALIAMPGGQLIWYCRHPDVVNAVNERMPA